MSVRRYLKDAFFADQAMGLLQRAIQARQGALGHQHGEALHDWRVLVRRLIEFTRLWARRPLRRQLLPLASPWIDATNPARDAEVEAAMISVLRQEHPGAWEADLARLDSENQQVLRREVEILDAFLADPDRAGEERRVAAILAPLPRFPHVPRRLPRRLKKSIRRFDTLHAEPATDLDALHQLRLATKSLRYGFEPLGPLDATLKPVLAELTALQRALGEHRDWQRLAGKSREAGLEPELIQAMETRSELAMAARPRQLKETEKWLADGWSPPRLGTRPLRRRLLRALPEAGREPVGQALALAAKTRKCHKRPDGSSVMIHTLRTALSLRDEAGTRESRMLTASLLSDVLADCRAVSEDTLAEQFGSQIVGAALALAPELEPPPEQRQRLEAAPAWVRVIALARELESLRFLAENEKPAKVPPETLEHFQALLPVFRTLRAGGARPLFKQLTRLLDLFTA